MSIRIIEDVIGISLFISISSSFFTYVHPQTLDGFSFVFLSISWLISFYLIFIAFKDYRQQLKVKKQDLEKKEFIIENDNNKDYLTLHKIFKKEDSL